MEIVSPPKRTFLKVFERHEPDVLDPTARLAAKKCKRFYFLRIVLGFVIRPNGSSSTNYPLSFGSCYHRFREVLTKTESLQDALAAALKHWNKETNGVDPVAGSRWEFLTEARLTKSCMVGYAHWKKEKEAGNIQVIQPEQPFDILLKDGKTRMGGRLDEGVRWNGKPWARDFKASSKTLNYWNRRIEPNDQFTCYTLGLSKLTHEQAQGCIVEVLRNTKKEGPEIIPLTTSRTQGQLDSWEEEQIFYNGIISLCREADTWPMEESECAYCDFRQVCTRPSEVSMIAKLEQSYVQRPWNYKTLGETEDA
jgi:hypothetical protein